MQLETLGEGSATADACRGRAGLRESATADAHRENGDWIDEDEDLEAVEVEKDEGEDELALEYLGKANLSIKNHILNHPAGPATNTTTWKITNLTSHGRR